MLQHDHQESACATSLTFPYVAVVFECLQLEVNGRQRKMCLDHALKERSRE